ncbi:MAG: alpha/beta fold hydrolase, partial [Desulfobulbaceae bacterium]|nr:alpha/beta fold hydrolase [Desulfobulbaceae bacterium]
MDEQHNVRSPFGVLIIHGFTAMLDSVDALRKPLSELGIPVSIPLLAGHGASTPRALKGICWDVWLADAERAFQKLSLEAERVIVIGHSMGALIALNLAVKYKGTVDSLVLAAPAIKLASVLAPGRPLHFASRPVSLIVRKWNLKTEFAGPRIAGSPLHYPWVPTDAVISFFGLIKQTLKVLGNVNVPVLILHNRRETTVLPESATTLYNSIATGTSDKSIVWLERSEHQIFCDCEREKALRTIIAYV